MYLQSYIYNFDTIKFYKFNTIKFCLASFILQTNFNWIPLQLVCKDWFGAKIEYLMSLQRCYLAHKSLILIWYKNISPNIWWIFCSNELLFLFWGIGILIFYARTLVFLFFSPRSILFVARIHDLLCPSPSPALLIEIVMLVILHCKIS